MEQEKAIKKAMEFYRKDLDIEGFSGNDWNAFMNIARKAIEFYKEGRTN